MDNKQDDPRKQLFPFFITAVVVFIVAIYLSLHPEIYTAKKPGPTEDPHAEKLIPNRTATPESPFPQNLNISCAQAQDIMSNAQQGYGSHISISLGSNKQCKLSYPEDVYGGFTLEYPEGWDARLVGAYTGNIKLTYKQEAKDVIIIVSFNSTGKPLEKLDEAHSTYGEYPEPLVFKEDQVIEKSVRSLSKHDFMKLVLKKPKADNGENYKIMYLVPDYTVKLEEETSPLYELFAYVKDNNSPEAVNLTQNIENIISSMQFLKPAE